MLGEQNAGESDKIHFCRLYTTHTCAIVYNTYVRYSIQHIRAL